MRFTSSGEATSSGSTSRAACAAVFSPGVSSAVPTRRRPASRARLLSAFPTARPGGLAVPGDGPRRLLAARARLRGGQSPARLARGRRVDDGRRNARRHRRGGHLPLGQGSSVYLCRVSRPLRRARREAVDGEGRRVLGQRPRRVLLRDLQARAHRAPVMANPGSHTDGDRALDRSRLQPPASALGHR